MSWLTANWEKLFGVFLAVVVSGLVGFFSALLSISGQLSDLKSEMMLADSNLKTTLVGLEGKLDKEMTKLNTELHKGVNPKLGEIASHSNKIALIEKTIIVLTKDAERLRGDTESLVKQTNDLIISNFQHGAVPTRPLLKFIDGN